MDERSKLQGHFKLIRAGIEKEYGALDPDRLWECMLLRFCGQDLRKESNEPRVTPLEVAKNRTPKP